MTRIVYVNGRYLPYANAAVHAEDRGFQFGDAVYEVCPVLGGRLVDEARHLARLSRSLSELEIASPMSAKALGCVMRETVRRNRVRDGFVYLQISRGAGPRDFALPDGGTPRTVVCLARAQRRSAGVALAATGIAVRTMPDIRWGRPDIKTVQLLPAILAKHAAKAAGAKEAWLVDRAGFITEGASSNAWILNRDGRLVTRQADTAILRGVTRSVLIDALAAEGIKLEERAFSLEEAYEAAEAFITSATNFVMPVVSIDGKPVGSGQPGETTKRLRALFLAYADVA